MTRAIICISTPCWAMRRTWRPLRDADKLGIRVMLDGVFSHTGTTAYISNRYGSYDSQGASQSKDSPYYPWYRFSDYPDKYACWWASTPCRKSTRAAPATAPLSWAGTAWPGAGSETAYPAGGWMWRMSCPCPSSRSCASREGGKPGRGHPGEVWRTPATRCPMAKCAAMCWGTPWTA